MNRFLIAAAIAGIAAPPALAGQAGQAEQVAEAGDPAAAAIVADCSARKFETGVELEKNGVKRMSKLKLCAAQGSDEAAWVRTLEDAKTKIAAHPGISEEGKVKIAAEFDAEIAKVRTAKDKTAESPPSSPPAVPAQLLSELPAAAAVSVPAATISAPTPAQARPRLTIRCLTPGGAGKSMPCTSLQRATLLTIHADGDLAAGTRLRFLRRGDERGEIALAGMRQGQMIRSGLPAKLCAGVATSKVEIQVMGSSQVFETLGPYQLRC